jgi:hypothetical protein
MCGCKELKFRLYVIFCRTLYMYVWLMSESYRLYGLPGFPFDCSLSCFAEVNVVAGGCRLNRFM